MKFWGSQSYIWIFDYMEDQHPYVVQGSAVHTNIKLLSCAPESNIMLYVNYISIF